MNRDMKYMNKLALLAADLEPVASARVAACIVHRGEIISYGQNSRKTSPFQARWGTREMSTCKHAETTAIQNALKRYDIETFRNMKTTLYICRIKNFRIDIKGQEFVDVFGISSPCCGCAKCCEYHSIKRVVFSLDAESVDDRRFGVWYP